MFAVFFTFIPLIVILAFVFPVAIGFVWAGIMLAIAVSFKVSLKGGVLGVLSVLLFMAFMATVTDIRGNPVTDYFTKEIFCEHGAELVVEKHVTHPEPGETHVSYSKHCRNKRGEIFELGAAKTILVNLIVYFGFALALIVLNLLLMGDKPARSLDEILS